MTMQPTARRAFLRGAMMAPTAALLAAPSLAPAAAETPLRALLRDFLMVQARVRERNGAWGAPPHLHAAQEADRRLLEDLRAQIMAEPLTSLEDLAVVLWVSAHIPGERHALWQRCETFVQQELGQ